MVALVTGPVIAESDAWGSNYAGHFLLEAQANGYFVSDYMLHNGKTSREEEPIAGR